MNEREVIEQGQIQGLREDDLEQREMIRLLRGQIQSLVERVEKLEAARSIK